ncbi:MAG: hypothetical protein FJ249_05155 [Nitrospira sp.]|nr:hypothetical protein [Nitrospira sp.]
MGKRLKGLALLLWLALLGVGTGTAADAQEVQATQATRSQEGKNPWTSVMAQAEELGLPTRFIRAIPPDFVALEFEDLHVFAAEYHPQEHRMVLNRALSFNAAGGMLRPLARLTHREVATFYHELFHAYMDYIQVKPEAVASSPDIARLLVFLRDQQRCRYQAVSITPVVQRKSATEVRFLSEHEAWEALNETWAVFVGWTVWSKLEQAEIHGQKPSSRLVTESWLKRLKKADRDGDLVGYYEPEDPVERQVAQKRYLAPSHRITPYEVRILLEVVFGVMSKEARRAAAVMEQNRPFFKESLPCNDEP